jgi:hypothetical protein
VQEEPLYLLCEEQEWLLPRGGGQVLYTGNPLLYSPTCEVQEEPLYLLCEEQEWLLPRGGSQVLYTGNPLLYSPAACQTVEGEMGIKANLKTRTTCVILALTSNRNNDRRDSLYYYFIQQGVPLFEAN